MANKKWSQLPSPVDLQNGDEIVGLRSGQNTRFNAIANTDTLPQGSQNIYATNDGGDTDNLAGLPTIDSIIAEVDIVKNNLMDHVDDLDNPHQTTLQQAFLQDPDIQITGSNSQKFTDNNNRQIQKTSTQGTQSHAPLVGLVDSQNITLSDSDVDINFYNSISSTSNEITLPLESPSPLFANNSTFVTYRNGDQEFTITAQSGVAINGVDGATVTLSSSQLVKFIRIAINEWITLTSASSGGVSSLNSLVGDLNITSPLGTINITPNGKNIEIDVEGADIDSSASYTIVGNTSTQFYQSPGNAGVYLQLLNDINKIHNQSATNFTIFSNSGIFGYTAVRYDGNTPKQFLINIDSNFCNIDNTTGTDSQFTTSIGIANSVSPPPLSYSVISNNPKPFTLLQNSAHAYDIFRSRNVEFQAVVTLNPGDVVLSLIESSSGVGNANILMAYQSFSITPIKYEINTSSSSSTLQDAYNIGDGSITVDDGKPFQVLDNLGNELLSVSSDDKTASVFNGAGNWMPTFSDLVGITAGITVNSSRFIKQNNFLIITQDLEFDVNDSVVSFKTDLPSFIVNNFTNNNEATLMGQSFSDLVPTAADGSILNALAVTSDTKIAIFLNSTIGSGTKTAKYSIMIEVQ